MTDDSGDQNDKVFSLQIRTERGKMVHGWTVTVTRAEGDEVLQFSGLVELSRWRAANVVDLD